MGLVTFRSLTPHSGGCKHLSPRLHWSWRTMYEGRPIAIVDARLQGGGGVAWRIGRRPGHYAVNWLRNVRGWADRIIGGPGLHRGRRDPHRIAVRGVIDFWRVSRLEPDIRLHLRAETELSGEAL